MSVAVNFSPGSFRLDQVGKEKLDDVGFRMRADPGLRAQITGYGKPGERIADGTRLGQGMGEARAIAVKNYLVVAKGIDPARIATSGEDSTQSRLAELALSEQ